ncbi:MULTISPECIES: DUF2147 domain-containing protein [Pacificibacter]|uniref:DUF2147 domain-containing protein n=1 Tax=Pacificibacter TaxID=1042323 RepID=UPI001C09D803|nr:MULTISPECIES: DUF2147 domain-containing protein [Pacificibacter]MBU2935392.1 DUF2147 domain-containing protein [Pacificibacter marinus]MDO6615547.1 DUF2147 domain-containing protein [Pacificibacter sp. 1_MG-2023]
MRKFGLISHAVFGLGALALIVLSAPAMAADPVEGLWQTQVDDGAFAYVKIAPCGDKICGHIARTFNDTGEYKSPNIGLKLVWDMSAASGGAYKGGQIYQPSTGKTFKSKMTLSGDRLNVSGCVGPICKKQTWARVK